MNRLFRCLLVASALMVPTVAYCNTIVFTGTLESDDDVKFFQFTIPTGGTVTVSTTMASTWFPDAEYGSLLGFVPILTLYDSTGAYNADNYDPAFTGNASLNWISAPGQVWYVALSQWGNQNGSALPVNDPVSSWAATFSQSGNTNYTSNNGCPRNQFCSGDPFDPNIQRVGNWDLTLNSPDPIQASQVPEPSTLYHTVGSLGVLVGLVRLRRNRTQQKQNRTNQ